MSAGSVFTGFLVVLTVIFFTDLPDVIGAPKKGRRCAPPPFTDRLSDDIKRKIEAVWQNYTVGENCKEQVGATREILKQSGVKGRGGKCGPPPFINRLPDDIKEKIEKIWAAYKPSDDTKDCDQERKDTKDILHEFRKNGGKLKKKQKEKRPSSNRGGKGGKKAKKVKKAKKGTDSESEDKP